MHSAFPDAFPHWAALGRFGFEVGAIALLISLRWLFSGNMGSANEVDVLPLARQAADPTWIPQDWYLNQPAGYRLLFAAIFGSMASAWGFLATSLVGRLLCYLLIGSGLVALRHTLKLNLLPLLLAVGLFFDLDQYTFWRQGIAAGEWLAQALETKVLAYGFVLWGISFLLSGRYLGMAVMLGIATSFHTLVGGWAFVSAMLWLLLKRQLPLRPWPRNLGLIALYGVASAFSVQPVLGQLLAPKVDSPISTSYAYVFLRLPHHLNPFTWGTREWVLRLAICLVLLGLSYAMARRLPQSDPATGRAARLGLAEFALVSLISFGLGLAIAPFDHDGKFLQYYPFRFGDVMLPLSATLLAACSLQQWCSSKQASQRLKIAIALLLALLCSLQLSITAVRVSGLQSFPGKTQGFDPDLKELTAWVRSNTPQSAIVITSPFDWVGFTWFAERGTIAKFKLLPQTAQGIAEWLQRLDDLSGNQTFWADLDPRKNNSGIIRDRLRTGYRKLTTSQAVALMGKYQASYMVTVAPQRLELPIAFQNERYRLYRRPD
ncbi:MAG TPA: DUF6798 domain-containing protein [Chroococcidiopsis sp.]